MSDESAWCGAFAQEYQSASNAAVSCVGYQASGNLAAASQPSGRKHERHKNSAKKTVTAETVLRSFNTWAFKREQPADPQLMLRMISEAISLGQPIPFILYWGKGPRCRLGEADIDCLDYLGALAQRVREAYEPGAAIKLIFTDTHAELNGHAPLGVREYFTEVEASAGERGFETCVLSQLTRSAEAVAACATDGGS